MRRITAVWGTGNYFNQIFNKLKHYVEIDYLIDSDTNKVGKRLTQKQIECILPKQIAEKNISLILIAVIDKAQCREIVKYLEFNKIKYDYADYYMDSLEIQRINSFNYTSNLRNNQSRLQRVIFVQIPNLWCNFRCSYCYLIQNNENVLIGETMRYPHKPEYISKALNYKRLGGMAYIDLTSFGETLLYKDIVELTKLLLKEGHIVSITTNGTITDRLIELLGIEDKLKERLFIRFSFHFKELEKKNLTLKFFENVKAVQKSVASMTVMMVAEDTYLPYKDKIKKIFIKELGALPQLDFVRESTNDRFALLSKKTLEEYLEEWSDFKSKKFEHRRHFFERKITEWCHAGDCCSFLNIFTGELYACSQTPSFTNIYNDITQEIQFKEFGFGCPCDWCVNTIMWENFGAIETSYKGPGYAEILNRIDKEGNSWIKKPLYQILNQKILEKSRG